ncbi:MAG: hypothetical protein RIS51_333 [Actinomycetota bacterium]
MASSTRQSRIASENFLAGVSAPSLELAEELFVIANALQSSSQLRSLLSDPSAEGNSKDQIVSRVFGKLSAPAQDLAKQMSKLRWSSTRDLADAAERLGVRTAASVVSKAGEIETLQSEMFQMGEVTSSDSDLELALSATRVTAAVKQELISSLFAAKVSKAALLLAKQAAESKTDKRFAAVLETYSSWIAQFAGESVAKIRVAKALSDNQVERLSKALSTVYGKNLQVNVEIDPTVIGGVHVAVEGEVIDATVLSKLTQARLQLS